MVRFKQKRLASVGLVLMAISFMVPSSAQADYVIQSRSAAEIWNPLNQEGTSSPGIPFMLDFTSVVSPTDVAHIALGFECTPFTTMSIVLDSSATVFSFSPLAPSTDSFFFAYYDPAYGFTESGDVPSDQMPQAWKDELADGQLSGRFWVNGTTPGLSFARLAVTTSFVTPTPEPATLALLAAGGVGVLARRRK